MEKKIDWEKIRLEYISGMESYSEMAKRLGVSRATLSNRAIEGAWAAEREKYRSKVRTDVQERMAQLVEDGMDTATRIAVKLLKRLEARVDDEEIPITASDFRAYSAAVQDIMVILNNGGRGAERIEVVIGDAADWAG